jgi:hypothetical protein
MSQPLIDQMKQRFDFDEWYDRNTLDENLFFWNYFLAGHEFPGWQPHSIREIKAPQVPPLNRSVWKLKSAAGSDRMKASLAESVPLKERAEPLLSVDSFECRSRADAHEFIIKILGEFQLPVVAQPGEVGDISFVVPNNSLILFARANLVHLIRNAGGNMVGVSDIASRLDSNLISKPEPLELATSAIHALSRAAPLRTLRTGERVLLATKDNASQGEFFTAAGTTQPALRAAALVARPPFYKVFYRDGEVFEEDTQEVKQLVYIPTSPGEQKVSVFAVDQSGNAVLQDLLLTVD